MMPPADRKSLLQSSDSINYRDKLGSTRDELMEKVTDQLDDWKLAGYHAYTFI